MAMTSQEWTDSLLTAEIALFYAGTVGDISAVRSG
jgi:hypothetical protein